MYEVIADTIFFLTIGICSVAMILSIGMSVSLITQQIKLNKNREEE